MAEKLDRIKQHRVLGRDNVGNRNKSEEGKNSNAEQRDGYGPGLLFFLGKSLRWIGDLELAFQNALEECGTEEVTAKLYERIMEGEETQKNFKGLNKPQFKVHLGHWRNLRMYHGPQ